MLQRNKISFLKMVYNFNNKSYYTLTRGWSLLCGGLVGYCKQQLLKIKVHLIVMLFLDPGGGNML